jgi:papain like protease
MTFSIDAVRIDGCLLDAPSPKDYRTVFPLTALPDAVDLREFCTRVEDQGQIGSCTSNAAVGALEYLFCRRDHRAINLSRLFVYFNARRLKGDGEIAKDAGASIRQAMASLAAFGTCREELWPYDPSLFAMQPPLDAYADAQRHEAVEYARVDGLDAAMRALAQGLPVVFASIIPKRCYEAARETGVMPAMTDEERATNRREGHAMLLVGYDKPARMFLVRNSWGEDWGDRGYCRIPFDIVETKGLEEEFWVIGRLEQETGFQTIRPGRAAARAPQAVRPAAVAGSTAASLRDQIRAGLQADLAASSRKISAIVSGQQSPAPAPPAAVQSMPRADAPRALPKPGWRHWEGLYFVAWFPEGWGAVESGSGVDISEPGGAYVGLGFVTSLPGPTTTHEVRAFMFKAIGIDHPRFVHEGPDITDETGTATQVSEFSAMRAGVTLHGVIKAQAISSMGGYGFAGYVRAAPVDKWEELKETLEAIEQSIVVMRIPRPRWE